MSPSTNTQSGPTTFTETTTLAIAPLNSSYATHNEFYTAIKDLMAEFKESVRNIITNQTAKVDKRIEKHLQPLSLQIKEISYKQDGQSKLLSTFTATYDDRVEKISNNKKISTKFKI